MGSGVKPQLGDVVSRLGSSREMMVVDLFAGPGRCYVAWRVNGVVRETSIHTSAMTLIRRGDFPALQRVQGSRATRGPEKR